MKRAVIVICDSLRRDLIAPDVAPFLSEFGRRTAQFEAHRGVFPSTTWTSAASIATGCLPARHGLLGNTMAIDEGQGLVCLSAGKPDFRDRLHRATGRTLHMPTLAERVARAGGSAIAFSNVSPGAAYFLDPDGWGLGLQRRRQLRSGPARLAGRGGSRGREGRRRRQCRDRALLQRDIARADADIGALMALRTRLHRPPDPIGLASA
jgi:Type I phosphodiesterase / nucleotide pyrophosphatase